MFSGMLMAAIWGCVAGSALLLGALLGYFIKLPQRLVASIMAFGAGVLMSAAVSYTHLDVYKRQHVPYPCNHDTNHLHLSKEYLYLY